MRVVVLRCGWMLHYAGVRAGDPAPIGGGSYNDQHPGHERFNFKDVGGRLYGYFQSSAKAGGLNLWCIDPNAKVDTLDKVLVIFVAKHPRGGQRVVGWYRDATVYATFQPPLGAARSDCGYQVECSVRDAVLLPEDQRAWTVPTGKGGMLRTHVRYPYDQTGTLNIPTWWSDILDNIKRYDGPNLIVPMNTNDEAKAADLLEEQVGGGGRGGFQPDSRVRRAIEHHAMKRAAAHFKHDGWTVEDTHVGNPFDLRISRRGEVVQVEVKGTTGDGAEVVLTRGEVESAERAPSALFILRQVKITWISDEPIAIGGEPILYMPWRVHDGRLTAVSYFYQPPGQ
jgi:hypothetical protein